MPSSLSAKRSDRCRTIASSAHAKTIQFVVAVSSENTKGHPIRWCLATRADGGLPSSVGFGLLELLWIGSTLTPYICIRRGRIDLHRCIDSTGDRAQSFPASNNP